MVIGDTETTEGLSEYVADADMLVIEATFLDRDAPIARDYGHLTAAEVASLRPRMASSNSCSPICRDVIRTKRY